MQHRFAASEFFFFFCVVGSVSIYPDHRSQHQHTQCTLHFKPQHIILVTRTADVLISSCVFETVCKTLTVPISPLTVSAVLRLPLSPFLRWRGLFRLRMGFKTRG